MSAVLISMFVSAVAGGMMIAASFSLVQEAMEYNVEDFGILAMFPKMFRK